MEDFAELIQMLLEIQSGGRRRGSELIAEDERLMDCLLAEDEGSMDRLQATDLAGKRPRHQ